MQKNKHDLILLHAWPFQIPSIIEKKCQKYSINLVTYNKYIEKNKNYLESKGYNADSKKLTTGRIEMARLETEMSETEILEKIKNFDVIHSLKIS